MLGHKQYVTALTWEPLHLNKGAGERLASSSKDGTVRVWNARTGQCLAVLSQHTASIECCKWGGEGLLYTASRDRSIKVWALNGTGRDFGKLVRTLTGHGHRVNTLALSTDYVMRTGPFDHTGKISHGAATPFEAAQAKYRAFVAGNGPERLVSGSDDFTLFLWNPAEDKKPLARLTGHQQAVNHLSFSPDGRYIASASFDKKVKVWDGRTGRFLSTLVGHVGAVFMVAWSPDSRLLVSASKDSTLKLWDVSCLSVGGDGRPVHLISHVLHTRPHTHHRRPGGPRPRRRSPGTTTRCTRWTGRPTGAASPRGARTAPSRYGSHSLVGKGGRNCLFGLEFF